jgi:hypothetical protein
MALRAAFSVCAETFCSYMSRTYLAAYWTKRRPVRYSPAMHGWLTLSPCRFSIQVAKPSVAALPLLVSLSSWLA